MDYITLAKAKYRREIYNSHLHPSLALSSSSSLERNYQGRRFSGIDLKHRSVTHCFISSTKLIPRGFEIEGSFLEDRYFGKEKEKRYAPPSPDRLYFQSGKSNSEAWFQLIPPRFLYMFFADLCVVFLLNKKSLCSKALK